MRPIVLAVMASTLGGGCMNDLLRPGVDGYPESPGPSDVSTLGDGHLAKEIESGYDRYGSSLAEMGQWRRDPVYGVRWCPRSMPGQPFVPYVTYGHWIPGEAAEPHPEIAPELARSPYWVSTGVPWGEVTMHHGWWVGRTGTGPTDAWCWIPGIRETPASVLWREADGFVAWAPAAPDGEYDDSSDDDFLSWSFEFLGTLFEDVVVDVLLQGDAADSADAVTSEERHRHNAVQRVGPTADRVATARVALSEYASTSPSPGSGAAGRTRLPPVRVIFGQLARDTRQGAPSGTRPSLPILSRSGGGGSTPGSRSSRAGGISGGGCASCRGTSSGSSHGGGGGSSHSGHSGGRGGDCGSHSSHHR
jgi:hypothetical protein